jgi:hypothetical protein
MYSRNTIKISLFFVVLSFISSFAFAANKGSSEFQYKYEGDLLPSDAGTLPRWERGISGGTPSESFYCSVADGNLTIDTAKGPSPTESAAYSLPGQYSELINEFYTFGDAGNPWDVKMDVGYTIEVKFKMDGIQIPNDSNFPTGKFAFWLFMQEGLHGMANDIQVFPNKIIAINSATPDILYTGDLTNKFYTLRIVRNPGYAYDAPVVIRNVYDIYLDGALIAKNFASDANSAYNQDDFTFGDAAGAGGGTDIKVEIDYVRIDLTGAYKPSYLKTDINDDRITNFSDFAQLAQNWALSTDADVAGHIDCTNPGNASICQ